MKQKVIIAVAVAGYLTIELPFILMARNGLRCAELPIFVSTLAMLAALMYGGNPSPKRALIIIGSVLSFIPLFSGPALLVGYILSWISKSWDPVFDIAVVSVLLLCWILEIIVVVKISRKLYRKRIPLLAEQWLAERALKRQKPKQWRRRTALRQLAVWVPSIIVLLTLFFWAPVMGSIGHLTHPFGEGVGQYRIRIPLSWSVVDVRASGDEHSAGCIRLRGMARAVIFWRPGPSPLSSAMSFRTTTPEGLDFYNHGLEEDTRGASSLSIRWVRAGRTNLQCWQFVPEFAGLNIDRWDIHCLSSREAQGQGLFAFFHGIKADVPEFYEMLQSTTQD